MTAEFQQSELALFNARVEKQLDEVVEHGNDQELFVASYLQGHFAVMAGQSQVQGMTQIEQMNGLMQASLSQAFAKKELEPDDQKQVLDLWQSFLA